MGIGTTAPTEKLDIVSSAASGEVIGLRVRQAISGTNYQEASLATGIDFNLPNNQGTSPAGKIVAGKDVSDWTNGLNRKSNLQFYTASGNIQNNIERMRITSAGNVGIGTTDPAAKLDVAGSSRFGSNNWLSKGDSSSAMWGFNGYYNGSDWVAPDATKKSGVILWQENVLTIRNTASAGSNTYTNRIVMDANGNVGIGTTAPSAKLHILPSTAGNVNTILSTNSATDGTTASLDFLMSSNQALNLGAKIGAVRVGINGAADLFFSTNDTSTIYTEKMRITSAGNVGIGTTNPERTLHVNSGTTDSAAVFESADPYVMVRFKDANTSIQPGIRAIGDGIGFYIDGSDPLFVSANGNVGIGTTVPAAKLQVLDTSGYNLKFGSDLMSGKSGPSILGNTTTHIGTETNSLNLYGEVIRFRPDGDNELVTIRSNGNVGIGITNPSAGLHVNGTSNSGIILATRSGKTLIYNPNLSGANQYAYVGTYSGENMGLSLGSNEGLNLNINTAGNVGIGTTNPQAKLDVRGSVVASDGTVKGYVSYSASDAAAVIGSNSNHPLEFRINNVEKARINTAGDLGIGTTNPTVPLEVHIPTAANTVALKIGPDANNRFSIYNYNDGDFYSLYNYKNGSYGDLNIGNSSSARLFIKGDSGNVGIGTSAPGGKLDVDGGSLTDGSFVIKVTGTPSAPASGTNGSAKLSFNPQSSAYGSGPRSLNLYPTSIVDGHGIGVSSGMTEFYTNTQYGFFIRPNRADINGTYTSTEVIRINSNGNVGIGTTNPMEKLDIVSSAASGEVIGLRVRQAIDGTNYLQSSLATGIEFYLPSDIGTSPAGKIVAGKDISNWADGLSRKSNLQFYTASGNIENNIERMRITSSGNVGIGTTNPGAKLDVNGDSFSSGPWAVIQGGGRIAENTALRLFDSGSNDENIINMEFSHTTAQANARIRSIIQGNSAANGADLVFETSSDNGGTFNSNQLYLDNSGNVGIGTSAPEKKLHIKNDQTADVALFIQAADGGSQWSMGAWSSNDATLRGFKDDGTESVRLMANGASYLTGGNVGIGTTAPGAKLDINYTGDGSVIRLESDNNFYRDITWEDGATLVGRIRYYDDASASSLDQMRFSVGEQLDVMRLSPSGNLWLSGVLSVAGAGNNYIAGKVGIGTTAPGEKLDVAGITYSKAFKTGYGYSNWITDTDYAHIYGTTLGGAYPFDATLGVGNLVIQPRTTAERDIILASGSPTPSPRLVVKGNGNVGIGTTNPESKLEVAGNSYFSGPITNISALYNYGGIQVKSGQSVIFNNADNNSSVGISNTGTSGVQHLRFAASDSTFSGNVGIGTTNPAYTLETAGNLYVHSNGQNLAGYIYNPTDTTGYHGLKVETKSTSAGSYPLYVDANGSRLFQIQGNGNVGIGLTNPQGKLEVRGDMWITESGDDGWRFRPGVGAGYQYGFADQHGNSQVFVNEQGTTNQAFLLGDTSIDNNGVLFGVSITDAGVSPTTGSENWLPRFMVSGLGNVGIGTSAPVSKLDIYDITAPVLTLHSNSTNQFESGRIRLLEGYAANGFLGAYLHYDGAANIFNIGVHDPNDTITANDTNVITVVRNNGYVGIGKTNPSYKLDVNGTINASGVLVNGQAISGGKWGGDTDIYYTGGKVGIGIDSEMSAPLHLYTNNADTYQTGLRIEQDGTGDALLNFYLSGTQFWNMGIDNSDADKFKIGYDTMGDLGAANVLTLDTAGNVGIGTVVPNAKLEVIGTVSANAFVTQGTPADYVFEEGYDLKSIEEQAAYMWNNKHLPALKSADELGGQG
ncbi:MAG: hypothetical protein ABIH39_01780 [Candidatus Margulisiibacteriota bacterium]